MGASISTREAARVAAHSAPARLKCQPSAAESTAPVSCGINDLATDRRAADTTPRAAVLRRGVEAAPRRAKPFVGFDIVPAPSVTISADRLRLGTYKDLGYFYVALGGDADTLQPCFSPVEVNLPVKDRRAYERACAAFNAVMDEHQTREDARNERRRAKVKEGP